MFVHIFFCLRDFLQSSYYIDNLFNDFSRRSRYQESKAGARLRRLKNKSLLIKKLIKEFTINTVELLEFKINKKNEKLKIRGNAVIVISHWLWFVCTITTNFVSFHFCQISSFALLRVYFIRSRYLLKNKFL